MKPEQIYNEILKTEELKTLLNVSDSDLQNHYSETSNNSTLEAIKVIIRASESGRTDDAVFNTVKNILINH